MNKVYIYTLNEKDGTPRYVGKTKNIKYRKYQHLWESKNGTYRKCNWIKSRNYDVDIEVLDVVDECEWIFWEMYWIERLKSWGYSLLNHTIGGDGVFGYTHSEETKKKMSETKKGKQPKNIKSLIKIQKNKGKSVYQYDLDGNLINKYDSKNQAILVSGCSNISRALRNNVTSGGYFWSHNKNYKPPKDFEINNTPKKIKQMDKNGNIVKIWDSVSEVSKTYTTIKRVLNGTLKTAGGYKWEYLE